MPSEHSDDVVTRWRCGECTATDTVLVPGGTGFYQGYLMVSDAHEEASPACHAENGHSFVRVELEEPRS